MNPKPVEYRLHLAEFQRAQTFHFVNPFPRTWHVKPTKSALHPDTIMHVDEGDALGVRGRTRLEVRTGTSARPHPLSCEP